ncbi:MAG: hypothetical protein ACRDTC_05310 [Pseudonocardiaceae bacterium]
MQAHVSEISDLPGEIPVVGIQVLGDGYGEAIPLGERDRSGRRRHQKLIEEISTPELPDRLAERIGESAVAGALAAGYVRVGPDDRAAGGLGELTHDGLPVVGATG